MLTTNNKQQKIEESTLYILLSHYDPNKETLEQVCATLKKIFPGNDDIKLSYMQKSKIPITLTNEAISISHSEAILAVVIAKEGPIGIDIELVRERKHLTKITKHFFYNDFQEKQSQAFYQKWTQYEAMCKAEQSGVWKMRTHFDEVKKDYHFQSIEFGPYVLSYCYKHNYKKFILHDLINRKIKPLI